MTASAPLSLEAPRAASRRSRPPETITGTSSASTSSRGERVVRAARVLLRGVPRVEGDARPRRPRRPAGAPAPRRRGRPGLRPGRSLTVTGRPLPSPAARGDRDRLVGVVEQRGAGAGLADLAHRAAHVEVDQVGARLGDHRRRLAHDVGVVAEQLHRDRVLVGVDAQELGDRALVAVGEPEAGHHLRGHQPRAVAARLQAHEPVADAGQRRQHEPVLERAAAERPGVGEGGHRGKP